MRVAIVLNRVNKTNDSGLLQAWSLTCQTNSAATGAKCICAINVAGAVRARVVAVTFALGSAVVALQASNALAAVLVGAPVPTEMNRVGSIASIGTAVAPSTAAVNLGTVEGAVHASGDLGVACLALLEPTTPVARTDTVGGYIAPITGAEGMWVVLVSADRHSRSSRPSRSRRRGRPRCVPRRRPTLAFTSPTSRSRTRPRPAPS